MLYNITLYENTWAKARSSKSKTAFADLFSTIALLPTPSCFTLAILISFFGAADSPLPLDFENLRDAKIFSPSISAYEWLRLYCGYIWHLNKYLHLSLNLLFLFSSLCSSKSSAICDLFAVLHEQLHKIEAFVIQQRHQLVFNKSGVWRL